MSEELEWNLIALALDPEAKAFFTFWFAFITLGFNSAISLVDI